MTAFLARENLSMDPSFWTSSLITSIWAYTKNLWQFRNQFIHGSSAEESAALILSHLHQQVIKHYDHFNTNTSYLLPCHHYLFQKPIHEWFKLPYDHLSCWLRSIDEVCSINSTQDAHLRSTARSFFSLFTENREGISANSTDSSYAPSSSEDTISLSTTTSLKQTLTNSLSSTHSMLGFSTSLSYETSHIPLYLEEDSILSYDASVFYQDTDNLDDPTTPIEDDFYMTDSKKASSTRPTNSCDRLTLNSPPTMDTRPANSSSTVSTPTTPENNCHSTL
jgi:hypothetical protein